MDCAKSIKMLYKSKKSNTKLCSSNLIQVSSNFYPVFFILFNNFLTYNAQFFMMMILFSKLKIFKNIKRRAAFQYQQSQKIIQIETYFPKMNKNWI